MNNNLKDRFDAADEEISIGAGSIESVIARADQRTRRTQVGSGVAALLLVAVIGFFAFQFLVPQDGTNIIDVTNTEGDAEGDSQDGATSEDAAPITEAPLGMADITYDGSFTTPEAAAGIDFGFGGDAIAFNPANDSLFITGYRINPEVAEISIPDFAPHDGQRSGLVEAEIVQGFGDITGGQAEALVGSEQAAGPGEYRINDLEVVDGPDGQRIAWTATRFYNADEFELPGHGHSSLDLSNPDVAGPWKLDEFIAEQSAGYVFDVPDDFADSFLNGRQLISGYLFETRGFTSQGAPFVAFDGPAVGDPEGRLDALELVNYEFPDHQVSGFVDTMRATGADWVTAADGQSAIVTVSNSMPLDNAENCTFGSQTDVERYAPQLSVYDPADLAAVAAGNAQPFDVEPYLVIDLDDHVIPVCGAQLAGVSFDSESNRLFVVQRDVTATEQGFDARPVIHVFTIG